MLKRFLNMAGGMVLCMIPMSAIAQPIFLGNDLTSNRFNALPHETLQIVTFYDGSTSAGPTLSIEVADVTTGVTTTITVGPLSNFASQIDTFEFNLNGHAPTCHFEVNGVVPNGVIDGLAFGLFWKDGSGNYHVVKSQSVGFGGSHFVGAWPAAMSDSALAARTPQITDGKARQQAHMTIFGTAYMQNGPHFFHTPAGTCTCDDLVPIEPDVRTQGFWKRQCKGPHPSGEHDNLPDYVNRVNSNETFVKVVDVDGLCDRLNPIPKKDKCKQAEAQFMAAFLNVASRRVGGSNCLDDPDLKATTVGEALSSIDGLLSNPGRDIDDCVLAQAIADRINNSKTLVDCAP
jgi:hypothetical protein